MLTEREKHGVSELLLRLSNSDLCSLAQTVTSRLIVPQSVFEAIEAIILHTETPLDLLKRRKVKREFLFKYLHDKRICIEGTADKSHLINIVLGIWGNSKNNNEVFTEKEDGDEGHHFDEEDSLPEAPAPSRNASYSSLCSLDPGIEIFSLLSREATSTHPVPVGETQEMATNFSIWFYDLLNSRSTDYGPHHFWRDASAQISLSGNGLHEHTEHFSVKDDGPEVCRTLENLITTFSLRFNPNNCPEGVHGILDPHGLVIVTVCGTLHNSSTCCGIFHQRFGLIRDPNTNNSWKIKFTEANLISKAVNEIPKLTQPELTVSSS